MKTLLSLAFLLITAVAFSRVEPVVPATDSHGSEVIKMRVQSYQVECEGAAGNTLCFQVQKGASIGTDNWETLLEPIDGFHYKPGFVYDITVKIERVQEAPEDDWHVKYTLVDIISQQASE